MSNSTYKIDENHTYMLFKNAIWLKVFYHNATFGDFYERNEADVLDSHTEQKFSILGSINSSFKINGKYEFLYEIPGKIGYNRWKQTNHPINTTKSMTPEENGFQPVKLYWPYNFGSLRKHNGCTVYCCSYDSQKWWYTIGALATCSKNSMPLIYDDSGTNSYNGKEVALWIRLPNINGLDEFKKTCHCHNPGRRPPTSVLILLIFAY